MSEACCGTCEVPLQTKSADRAESARGRAFWLVVLAGLLMALGAGAAQQNAHLLSIGCYAASIAISVPLPARRAWTSLRGRTLDINVLMLIAVAGAIALSDWLEAAAVVWLFGVAQWVEVLSLARARHAIRSLVTLAPAEATVRRDGIDRVVPAEQVVPGDIVILEPGERVPVDATVVDGESAVDQSPLTGESWPIDAQPGVDLLAGSVNGTGALELRATRAVADSALARITRMVEQAQRQRAPIQTLVDRFARRYTPAVVCLALLVAVVPPFFVATSGGWSGAFALWGYRALALLVVACPCALVISTPVSVVSALTAAARHGVLIKGGSHLERLASVTCVVFDKTGTLTDGRVNVTHVMAVDGASEDGLLTVAASLETRSEHPIGRAIVARARGEGLRFEPGSGFQALPGLGAEATVSAAAAVVGSHRLFHARDLCTPRLHQQIDHVEHGGATAVLVAHAGAALGVLGLTDRMRDGGRQAVSALRALGVTRLALLSGDRARNAEAASAGAGLDEAHGDLMPEEKVAHIARLREAYGPVAMIGDGINDAPALAAADVGIAMGVAGTDVALETADVALMTDDLSKLPYALRLAKATLRNIRFNVALALGLKVAFVILAAAGLATLWMAVLADTGASLLVTASSLRLLRLRTA
ncbi:MAG: cation-translocating P-type ATPase [Vicinamibacterales bacterium]